MSDLAKKLGIKSGQRVSLLDAPLSEAETIQSVSPAGVDFFFELSPLAFDIIIFWPKNRSEIETAFVHLQNRIQADGAIWAVIPNKKFASKTGFDFTWDEMQAHALKTDLVDNKIASINEQSYATRYVIRKDKRQKYSNKL